MMENPATWGPAERVVQDTLTAVAGEISERGPEDYRIGLSMARRITDALRDAGLLNDPAKRDVYNGYLEGDGILSVFRPGFGAVVHFAIHDGEACGGPWTKRRWARARLRRAQHGKD